MLPHMDRPADRKPRLERIETDILNNFKRLGVAARTLDGKERLSQLHAVFHMDEQLPFQFEWDWLAPSGLSTKDFIAPSSFEFRTGKQFRMGKKYGAVSFLQILAPELNDRLLADFLDMEQRGLYYAFATLVYGFLSIIVAITIFHIMNTISMGVSARTRQYGVMRAIGMSNQQLTRMISAEAASYAISGVILGCIFGLLFHWFLYSSLITRTFGNPWSVPWLELCLIIGVILATTVLAVRGPARRLHAMSIVENISSQ